MLGVCEDERTGHKLASDHIFKTSRSRVIAGIPFGFTASPDSLRCFEVAPNFS